MTPTGQHRIMLMANAPWCKTGYGVQAGHLAPRLRDLGHDMAVFAFYGLAGGMLSWDGINVYPQGVDMWGADILGAHMKHFKADILITLVDVWVTDWFGKKAQAEGYSWYPWLPIDQEPAPERVIERLEGCAMALPYARFGERMLHEAGVTNTCYIPHAVDTGTFKPGDRAAARRVLGLPEDKFIVGIVAANKGYPSRKCLPEQLEAFAQFHRRKPDSLLYLHTLPVYHDGIDVPAICDQLGISDAVSWTPSYSYIMGLSEERMATLYQAFDVLSEASMGEGFGIPLIEAQACGIPVITTDATSMTELMFSGVLVRDGQRFWTPLNAWAFIPSIPAIADGYEYLYEQTRDERGRNRLCEQAVEGAQAYDWDRVVADYWQPFLESIL